MIVEKAAIALRRVMVRTARSPLKPLWAALYAAIARLVAVVVAPRGSGTSVYLAGSLASGEPVYGISDIDLVAVAADESESRRVRRRFDALCRAVPPVRDLVPEFATYHAADLERVLAGPYLVNGLDDGRAVFLGADAVSDENGLLERPGLYGEPEWRRLRGPRRPDRPADLQHLLAAWLELQYRWRWALRATGEEGVAPRLAPGLVAEAARIWLWLAHGERHGGRTGPLERALVVMDEEEEGLRYALEANRALHRSPPVAVEKLFACFVSISDAIAGLVDERTFGGGTTEVNLACGDAGDSGPDGVPLLDWRAVALPMLDWSIPELPRVVEERLILLDGDPADPTRLAAAAAEGDVGRVPALRHGSLLIEPTFDVWGRGALRTVQCRASDPVSAALLDGRAKAAFPERRGWSANDWARRAAAEHRGWLLGGRSHTRSPQGWVGARPWSVAASPATLGLLLSAARSALFLESIEEGSPELPVTFTDVAAALGARDPGIGADAFEACAVLEEGRREQRSPQPELVERLRRDVRSFPPYASEEMGRVTAAKTFRASAIGSTPPPESEPLAGGRFSIRRGMNLSHWFSQTQWLTDEERLRSFSRDDALRIRELGLDHVRLPLDEHCLWHADGGRDRRAFDLLLTTIEWCREAELAVILCIHALWARRHLHPGGATGGERDRAEEVADLWRDLSDLLAGHPVDALAYELLGEPTGLSDDQWNHLAAVSIAAIREREPQRTILLGSNRKNSYRTVASLSIPDDPHLILSFHYYEPTLLTHYRADWVPHRAAYSGPITYPGVPIPAAELASVESSSRQALERINLHYDRTRIREDLALPLSVAERSGQPLHCGEFGVKASVPDEPRLRWYRDVIDALEEYEIAWSIWDLRGEFGLYSGGRPTIAHQAIAERRFAD
jgi:endoglucanase